MSIAAKTRFLVLPSLVLVLVGLSGCSGTSSKNVTTEEQETVKSSILSGLPEAVAKANKFTSFEGVDDPDAKDGKVKYVRVMFKNAEGGTGDMIVVLKDGKVVKHVPNGAGNDWKKDLSKYR
jgi:hypothetical protein